jgi:hypothetical protein
MPHRSRHHAGRLGGGVHREVIVSAKNAVWRFHVPSGTDPSTSGKYIVRKNSSLSAFEGIRKSPAYGSPV